MSNLDLAVIGNCVFGSLVDERGRINWSCMPRFDGDPLFCGLLNGNGDDEKFGFFDIVIDDFTRCEQHYLRNTAILVTTLYDAHGSAVEITDFAPRFKQFGRIFRPLMTVRRVRPVLGNPRVRIRLRPVCDYGASRPEITHGSNHIRYITPAVTLRLTTDAPVSFILDEVPFVLEEPFDLILGADESLTRPITETAREFLEQTHEWWIEWARYLSLPFEWQTAVIRAAITLKLCNFEESGAIIAALTTSIPEAAGSGRNWDYRYCWLRDAYFVVHALNRLGATKTMEDYLRYITNIAAGAEDGRLQPVYGITQERRLTEREVDSLAGYRAMGPVRIGNQAFEHVQNDVYGSVILAGTQYFFDERLVNPGDLRLFERLERLGEIAVKLFDKPDAGLWELRTRERVHTSSAVMCWAGCNRLAKIARRLARQATEQGEEPRLKARAEYWRKHADRMHAVILEQAWNEKRNSFVDSFGGEDVDASLLLLHQVGFVEPSDPRFAGTVKAVEKALRQGDHLFRYTGPDDLGTPESAFNICTFWYIEALAALGRFDEARGLFENMLSHRNHCGLLSEDLDPKTGELWGNFPQTYSMVGLVNAAMRLSKAWEEAF